LYTSVQPSGQFAFLQSNATESDGHDDRVDEHYSRLDSGLPARSPRILLAESNHSPESQRDCPSKIST